MPKDTNKPRGRTTAYAFFVQQCREELKKKNPNETVVFAEFSKKCAEKWKAMKSNDKKRFDDMADKDKVRFDKEMVGYTPSTPTAKGGKMSKKGSKRAPKDPNAPKRALSAFFCFCNEERAKVRAKYPSYGVGDIAKELGKRWEVCPNKSKFEELSARDKQRYEREMAVYKKSGGAASAGAKKPAAKPAAKAAPKKQEESEEEDDDEEEEEEDDEDNE